MQIYKVGGAVRDALMGLPVHDHDWVVVGATPQQMLDAGYLLAPGALFHASRQPCTLMRINFATTQDAAFWKTLEKVVQEMR